MMRIGKICFFALFLAISYSSYSQTTEVLCNDGIDNDGDGVKDCADGDCVFAATIEKGCRCYDNLDNDGDGKVDKADPDCATYYGLSFVGQGSNCSITPPGSSTPFAGVGNPTVSGQNTADTQSKVAVGDVDGDGLPDAVITSKWNSEVRVVATKAHTVSGTTYAPGDIKSDFKTTGQGAQIFPNPGNNDPCKPANLLFEHEVLIADIDGDKKAEIFCVVSNRKGNPESPPTCYFLLAFKYTKDDLTVLPGYPVRVGEDRPGTPGLADFDSDGKAELYLKNRIYAAENGTLLADGGGNWDSEINSAPTAVQMTGDSKLELVCGNLIYNVPSLSSRTFQNMTLYKDMNTIGATKCYPRVYDDITEYGLDNHSSTSVADIDEDGFIDVMISGSTVKYPAAQNTTIFYWNVQKGIISSYAPPDNSSPTPYASGWPWGTGRINIGDSDGDGDNEATFIAGSQIFNMEFTAGNRETLITTPKWIRVINDSRSGILTVTIYDFNNDANPEMVYRDSQELVVIDGKTGQTKQWSATCQSHTYTEGPIIADVNGDGGTDICVPCYRNNSFDINSGLQQQALGEVRLFFSSANAWLPTRKVWNQPGYFVININDNLTLPRPQLDQNLIFGTAPCPNGLPGPQQPLNMFLNQIPNVSASGCPVYPAPDLTYVGDTPNPTCTTNPTAPGCDTDGDGIYKPAVVVIPPICGNLGIQVYFNIKNTGDLPITDNVPVSFFNGDPRVFPVTATRLYNSTIAINNLQVGATLTSPTLSFNGPGTTFQLFILLYNDGSVLPVNLAGQSTKECTISNNIYQVQVTPDPITVTIEKLSDNFKCSLLAPNTGALRVHIFKGATEVTDYSPYSFQWYSGTDTSTPIAGKTQYNITGIAEGNYTVVVTETAKGCTSNPITANVVRTGSNPTINLTLLSSQTTCSPLNGKVQADIVGGNTGYTFAWYDISLTPLGITGPTANNLAAGNYVVLVSTTDGCPPTASAPITVPGPQFPDAQAQVLQHVVDCSNLQSGSVQADALTAGVVQPPAGYTFNWYFYNNTTSTRGSILPAANGTGQTRTGLAVGYYQAEIKDNATQCTSPQSPIVQVMSQTVIPDPPAINQIAPQTSCDLTKPNGILNGEAVIAGVTQNPAGFTFEWFLGLNTLPANKVATVSGTNGKQLDKGTAASPYTLKVTTSQNCSSTASFTIADARALPVVTLSQLTPNSVCDPANATLPYNGSIGATVTFNGANVTLPDNNYTFAWYDGTTTTTSHLPAPADPKASTLTGLKDGNYTVTVTRTDLFCTSIPDTEPVAKTTIDPLLTATSTGSNNCDPALTPDGTVTVTVTNTAAAPGPFTYQWFDGNAVGVSPLGAANNGTTATAIKVGGPTGAPRPYTVKVLNTTTGCVNNTTQFVADNSVVPVLATSTQPNSICSPATNFNGSMTVSVTNIPALYTIADYTFVWYDGATTASQHNPQPNPTTTVTLPKLDVGTYSVIGTNTKTGCVSAIATNQVANQKLIPSLVPSSTGSNNCDPSLAPDGTVSVAVSVAAGPFSYQWYKGNGDPIAGGFPVVPTAVNNGTSQTAIGLGGPVGAPVSYTVLVTDNITGCNNFVTTAVADNSVIPVLSTSTAPNSICAPSTSFNGSMTVSVTNIPALYTIADYTFVWYDGNSSATQHPTQPSPASTLTLPTLDVGTYSVIGTNTKTGCVSALATNQVADGKILPSLAPSSTGSNNCIVDPGNGINNDGTATVAVTVAAGPFDFKWFAGAIDPTVGSPATIRTATHASTDTAPGLGGPIGAPNSYTAQAIDKVTGCSAFVVVAVADVSSKPVLSTSTGPNSMCDPTKFNGSMTVGVTNIPVLYTIADYTFVWYDGATTATPHAPQPVPASTLTLPSLDVGTYSVVGTNIKTGCVSTIATNTVANQKLLPSLAPSSAGSTNCVTTPTVLNNGSATVDVTVAAGPFDFKWYNGAIDPTVAPPATIRTAVHANTDTAPGLGGPTGAPNSYTVHVIDQLTGCGAYTAIAVADISQKPTFTLTPTDNPICNTNPVVPGGTNPAGPSAFGGQMTIGAMTHPVGGTYTFQWYDGIDTSTPNTTSPTNTTAILTQLDNGKYTATITITELGCVSDPQTAEVLDVPTVISLTPNVTPSTNCAPDVSGNGIASVTVTAPAVGNFVYQWYDDGVVDAAKVKGGKTAASLGNDLQGTSTFTVLVTNLDDGCQNNIPMTVVDGKVTPTIAVSVVSDNTVCVVAPGRDPNGELLATVGSAGANFTVTWVGGVAPSAVAGAGDVQFTKLQAGAYTATVKNNDTGCVSQVDGKSIADDFTYPDIDVVVTPQTSCSTTPNGVLTATWDGGTNIADYDFQWYDGIGAVSGNEHAPASDGVIDALASDDYTIEVTTKATGCSTIEPWFVPNNIVNPTFTLAAGNPVTICGPTAPLNLTPNGEATATATFSTNSPSIDYTIFYVRTVDVGGAGGAIFPTDPDDVRGSAEFFDGVALAAAPMLTDLSPGYLTAMIVDNNTSCESTPTTVQIIDATADYSFQINGVAVAGLCSTTNPGGQIDITVVKDDGIAPPAPCATCSFEWYPDSPTNTDPINFFETANLPAFAGAVITTDEDLGVANPVGGVSAGTYTVVVRDASNGCGDYDTQIIPTTAPAGVVITPTSPTMCVNSFNATNNGAFKIDVTPDVVNTDGYTVNVYKGLQPILANRLSTQTFGDAFDPAFTVNEINLDRGDYLIEVIDEFPTNKPCPQRYARTLTSKAFNPIVTINNIDPNTSCDPNLAADGGVTLTVTKDALDTSVPSYLVAGIDPPRVGFSAPDPTFPPGLVIGASGSTIGPAGGLTGLQPVAEVPDYTITVLDNVSKCFRDVVVSIPDAVAMPAAFSITPSPETLCSPASDGSATASVGADPVTEYDFEWYQDAGLTVIVNDGIAVPKPGGGATVGETLNQSKVSNASFWPMPVAPGQGVGNRTFYGRAKKNATAASGVGCYTQAVQVTIVDSHVSPDMTLTPTFNSVCGAVAGGIGDGTIDIVADADPVTPGQQVAPGFTIDWTNGNGALLPKPQISATGNVTLPQLGTGSFTVTTTRNDNGCNVIKTAAVPAAPFVVTVNTNTKIDQRICDPDGEITITEITVDRAFAITGLNPIVETTVTPLTTNYDFEWHKGAAGNPGAMDPSILQDVSAATNINSPTLGINTNKVDDPGEFETMGAGTYYVVATRKAGAPALTAAGCPALPYRVDILDKHQNPLPTLTALSNTSCLPAGPGEGEIMIDVTDATDVTYPRPVAGFTFDYTWPGPGPTPAVPVNNVPGSGNGNGSSADGDDDHYTELIDNAAPYVLNVKNALTGCSATASATIVKNATPVFVQNVTVTDEILCAAAGDGSITVTKVSMNDRAGTNQDFVPGGVLPDGDIDDFDFDWTRNGQTITTTEEILDNTTYVAPLPGVIGAGTYTVVAKRVTGVPGAGCPSAPFTVTIQDKKVNPVVTLTPLSNTSCVPLPGLQEGEIKIVASDGSTAPVPATPGFTYNWTAGPVAIATAPFPAPNDGDGFGNGDTDLTPAVDNDDDHEFGLIDGTYSLTVTSNKSGCTATASTTITKNALPVFVQNVTVVDQVACAADGSLTVAKVTLNDRNGTTQTFDGTTTPSIANFEFTWTRAGAAGTQTTAGTALNTVTYLPGNFGGAQIGADTYTVVAKRIAGAPGNGCTSTPFSVDIKDMRIFPVVTLTPFANTSCSSLPADLEGEITVKVTDLSTAALAPPGFAYTWTTAPTAIAPGTGDGDGFGGGENDASATPDNDDDHPNTLAEGVYVISVVSNKSNCSTTSQTEIFKNSTPVFTQLVIPTDQVLCTADGKLIVDEVRVIDRNGVIQSSKTDFPIADFDFTYRRQTSGVIPGVTAAFLDITNHPTIGADTYFVMATRVNNGPGFGCSSPEYKVDIQNKQIVPVVSLTPLANTSCDPLFFEGEIQVKVTDASINLPAPLAPPFTYSYNWTVSATPGIINGAVAGVHDGDQLGGGDADGAGFDNDGDHPRLLSDGDYTLSVTNTQTGCSSVGSTTIFKNSTPVFTQLVTATPQVICNPDGTLVVEEVRVTDRNGNVESNLTGDFPLSDFAFRYDRGTIGTIVVDNTDPLQPVSTLDVTTYPTIGFDTYYVYATRVNGGPGQGCASAPYKVDILDRRVYPQVSFTSIANSSCNVLKPNGSLTATASELNGSTADPYTFAWTINSAPIAPPAIQTDGSNTSVVTNAVDGNYIVTATNTVTGCPIDGSYDLLLDQVRSTPNIIDVLTVDPLDCNPSASAEVTKITLGTQQNSTLFPPNVPPNNEVTGAALLAFIYDWRPGNPSNPPIVGATAPLISTLVPGNYYVTVQDPTTDCVSGPKEVIINDDDIIYPLAEILQTAKDISCLAVGTAALSATGDGQDDTNPDYTFAWHNSLDASGPVIATTSAAGSLSVGNYSVEVKRLSTGCTSTQLYIIPDDAPLYTPVVSLAGVPRTLCVGTDGALVSRVINILPDYPFPLSFTSDGYVGATPNLSATPDFPNMPNVPGFAINFEQTGVNEGTYTVRITDNNTGCFATATEQVLDLRTPPVVTIIEENPLTNCDPAKKNGQLSATSDGKVLGYNYEWYAGATVTTPPGVLLSNQDKLIGQGAGTYVVRSTQTVTGCFADKSGAITDQHLTPPTPSPEVVFHRTSCITPNGWVTATVGGETFNYTFSWYDGSSLKPTADNVGFDYQQLDIGDYTVTATDDITGCVSLPITVEVEDKRVIPEFTIATTPSFCVDTGRPRGTGSAILELTNPDIVLQDVQWTDKATGAAVGIGAALYEIFPGVYEALATTTEGCTNTGAGEVATEISPYNGISGDRDGLNDVFIVDCISLFPNNNVKIFNRNGIKVYEADGYNNGTISFDGTGVDGIYLQGVNLPAGTYFYIVDKKDGTKPVAGYLELER